MPTDSDNFTDQDRRFARIAFADMRAELHKQIRKNPTDDQVVIATLASANFVLKSVDASQPKPGPREPRSWLVRHFAGSTGAPVFYSDDIRRANAVRAAVREFLRGGDEMQDERDFAMLNLLAGQYLTDSTTNDSEIGRQINRSHTIARDRKIKISERIVRRLRAVEPIVAGGAGRAKLMNSDANRQRFA